MGRVTIKDIFFGNEAERTQKISSLVDITGELSEEYARKEYLKKYLQIVVGYMVDTYGASNCTEVMLAMTVALGYPPKAEPGSMKIQSLKDSLFGEMLRKIANSEVKEGVPFEYKFYAILYEVLGEQIDEMIIDAAMAVIKWHVLRSCSSEEVRTETLKIVHNHLGDDQSNDGMIIMNYVFDIPIIKRKSFLLESVTQYKKENDRLINVEKISDLLWGIYFYLENRPLEERIFENVPKLLGAAKNPERGIRSPYYRIISEEVKKDPDDLLFRMILENLNVINNNDIAETVEYLRWDVMKKNPEGKDYIIGMINVLERFGEDKILMNHMECGRRDMALLNLNRDDKESFTKFTELYTPDKITERLDQYIIGQESAKKNVAYAVYNHMLRILHPEQKLNKSNVLLIGPSGCGKTEIIRRLKEMFLEEGISIPIVISDFSGVVATPWRGRNKEEALARLFDEAGKDITKTQRGIVFLDEFDKIIPKVAGGKVGYDYNTELQGQMLGMLEGTSVQVKVKMKDHAGNEVDAKIQMKTDNILFILSGAFDGLDEIIRQNERENKTTTFGMVSTKKSHVDYSDDNVTLDTLMGYGLRAELAGRLGYVSVLNPLLKEDMIRILKEAKDNIIEKYQNAMFAEDGIELEFREDAYEALAEKVQEFNIGARGLNAILHDVLADVMFKAPSIDGLRRVVITGDKVNGDDDAIYIKE